MQPKFENVDVDDDDDDSDVENLSEEMKDALRKRADALLRGDDDDDDEEGGGNFNVDDDDGEDLDDLDSSVAFHRLKARIERDENKLADETNKMKQKAMDLKAFKQILEEEIAQTKAAVARHERIQKIQEESQQNRKKEGGGAAAAEEEEEEEKGEKGVEGRGKSDKWQNEQYDELEAVKQRLLQGNLSDLDEISKMEKELDDAMAEMSSRMGNFQQTLSVLAGDRQRLIEEIEHYSLSNDK